MSEINFNTSTYDERQEEEELTNQLQQAKLIIEAAAAQKRLLRQHLNLQKINQKVSSLV